MKGKLVRVTLPDGRVVKMYEADAMKKGLVEPEQKARQKPQDKAAIPEANKEPEPAAEPDDFTTIHGVGPATARALVAHGIVTFGDLREAGELDYLPDNVNAAIEKWRAGDG